MVALYQSVIKHGKILQKWLHVDIMITSINAVVATIITMQTTKTDIMDPYINRDQMTRKEAPGFSIHRAHLILQQGTLNAGPYSS